MRGLQLSRASTPPTLTATPYNKSFEDGAPTVPSFDSPHPPAAVAMVGRERPDSERSEDL